MAASTQPAKPGESNAAPSEIVPGSVLSPFGGVVTPPVTVTAPSGLTAAAQSSSSIKIDNRRAKLSSAFNALSAREQAAMRARSAIWISCVVRKMARITR